jgi:radical SAM-linked protein
MKNARIFFKKFGPCKYISHLDLNRVMLRAVGRSRIEVWHTEGFNKHAYITFALPLSLGYASECESMDFRLLNDDEDMDAVPGKLNPYLPEGLVVVRCREAVMKPAAIESASYDIILEPMNDEEISYKELYEKLGAFLNLPEIIVSKKTKKGSKDVDLKEYILAYEMIPDEKTRFTLTLPAGGSLNINPSLLINALAEEIGVELYADVTRTGIYVQGGGDFE